MAITTSRNYWGRQRESFVADLVIVDKYVRHCMSTTKTGVDKTSKFDEASYPGIFIRAPGVVSIDAPDKVSILSTTLFGHTSKMSIKKYLTVTCLGKPPGLVVNVVDSQSKPWSLDVGSNPRLHLKTRWNDGPLDGRKITKDNKDSQMVQVTPKKKFKKIKFSCVHVKRLRYSSFTFWFRRRQGLETFGPTSMGLPDHSKKHYGSSQIFDGTSTIGESLGANFTN